MLCGSVNRFNVSVVEGNITNDPICHSVQSKGPSDSMTCGKGCNTGDQASHANNSTDLDIVCDASSGPYKEVNHNNCKLLSADLHNNSVVSTRISKSVNSYDVCNRSTCDLGNVSNVSTGPCRVVNTKDALM